MKLNELDLNELKLDPEKNGYLNQLSYSDEKGWEIVGLNWFQRNFLRRLPGFILRLFCLSHVANTQSSYLYSVRYCNIGVLEDVIRMKVNDVFHQKFYDTTGTGPIANASSVLANGASNVSIEPKGIINRGNNCYMIAMMQVLINNKTFLDMFYEKKNDPTITGADREILNMMNSLILAYQNNDNPQEVEKLLDTLKCAIHRRSPDAFRGGLTAQQDSSAVVEVLFDALKISGTIWSELKIPPHTSSLSLESIAYFHLAISPPNIVTMDHALKHYFQNEQVDYRPENHNAIVLAERSKKLGHLPDILPITLMRYDFSQRTPTKITKQIQTNGRIDLRPYVKEEFQGSTEYEVVGVVHHQGGYGGGHYVSEVLKDGKWYRCNDSSVEKIAAPDLTNAYSYIFKRVEITPPVDVPKGIKREGNTCYLNAFYQSMFALDSLKNHPIHQDHQHLTEDEFFQKVLAERSALFQNGDITNEMAMQELQQLLPRLTERYGLKKIKAGHEIPVVSLAALNPRLTLAESVQERLRTREITELPDIIPVIIGSGQPNLKVRPNEILHVMGKKYRLKSAIAHVNNNHYKALILKDERWYECNDLTVTRVEPLSSLPEATTFFYEVI